MTAKELKEVLAGCPDNTVIAIVNYRGWLSRNLSFYSDEPIRMVKDQDCNSTPHLFLYKDNSIEMVYGITPKSEIDDAVYWEKEKQRRVELEAKRKERKQKFMNFFRRLIR